MHFVFFFCFFFGPYFHSLSQCEQQYTHIYTQSVNTSLQVSFLVMEGLGEDAMPGFPGPSNELSRITLPS